MPSKNIQKVSVPTSHIPCTLKSHTTLKCLIGVELRGGIIFIFQLYEGSISDKEIVKRSGFIEILKQKLTADEIKIEDAIMTDKGLDIEDKLKQIGLRLNIPPFLKNVVGFDQIWTVACLLSNFQKYPVL